MTANRQRHRSTRRFAEPTKKFTLQLPASLADELQASADADSRSRQAQLAVLLREALDARKGVAGAVMRGVRKRGRTDADG